MPRCSNETPDGSKHDAYPLVVTVMNEASAGADGAVCLLCLAKALAPPAPAPTPPAA